MKEILLVLILLTITITIAGKESNKGKVSLIFNGEKIELPINVVTLRKENKVLISIRAELNNENVQQLISLQLGFQKLSADGKNAKMYDDFLVNVVNKSEGKNEELLIRMKNNGANLELFVKKGYRIWNNALHSMRLIIEEISFENSSIIIKGNLYLKVRDGKSETPLEPISEIEDCKFEIII